MNPNTEQRVFFQIAKDAVAMLASLLPPPPHPPAPATPYVSACPEGENSLNDVSPLFSWTAARLSWQPSFFAGWVGVLLSRVSAQEAILLAIDVEQDYFETS